MKTFKNLLRNQKDADYKEGKHMIDGGCLGGSLLENSIGSAIVFAIL